MRAREWVRGARHGSGGSVKCPRRLKILHDTHVALTFADTDIWIIAWTRYDTDVIVELLRCKVDNGGTVVSY